MRRATAARGVLVAVVTAVLGSPAVAQRVGRDAALSLHYPPLAFEAPIPETRHVGGVPVLHLQDPGIPLTTVFARFKGGYSYFGRERYAAGTALPALLRYGGTATMSPDSVDRVLEFYAIQTSFGGGGESIFSSVNTLTEHLEVALEVWGRMLAEPAFDTAQVEIWRLRELEGVRRRQDDPQRLAFSEFNRIMFGDHPIGWEMEARDLDAGKVTPATLHELQGRVVCRDNLVLGVTGDAEWRRVSAALEALVSGLPECSGPLPSLPVPDIRTGPHIYLIPKDLEQSVIVMAEPHSVHMGNRREYFAAQIGNLILGGGGFSSRLLTRVRSERGYAYSAASLWTTPRRYDGIVGALTRTRPENTVPALRLILETMDEMTRGPPTPDELRTAVDDIVNGFVFNFESPARIVSRRMFYLAQGLDADWLEQYLEGIRRVSLQDIHRVFREHVHPERMTILVLGDPQRIGEEALAELGPVTVWDGSEATASHPSGSRRFPR